MHTRIRLSGSKIALSSVVLALSSHVALGQCERFLRGDSNADGALDLSDGISTLNSLFLGTASSPCADAADANDSGDIDLSDGIFIFSYLFADGRSPPLPGPTVCGADATQDNLSCLSHPPCADSCPCEDGEIRPCGTSEIGECRFGVQTCVGVEWGPCEGAIEPSVEQCDGLDNDCDGQADQNFVLLGSPCDGPDSDSCANGTWICAGDGWGLECASETVSGLEEVCDEIDNDCDNLIDEDFDMDGDSWTICAGDCDDSRAGVNPRAERDFPDGIDNDCDGMTDEDEITTSYDRDIQPIWTASCTASNCHDSMMPQSGMDLTTGVSYAQIVSHASEDVPSMDRVKPLDPDRSYLWHKLNGTQLSVGGKGTQMPAAPSRPLAEDKLELIRTWILEGAQP
jgi:hypothetical protein